MTNLQKGQIERMRKDGMSFARISTSLGIPLTSVQSHCSRHGIKPNNEHCCKNCGKPLTNEQRRRGQIFCSSDCRAVWWRNNKKAVYCNKEFHFTCQHCKRPFVKHRNDHPKFCSHECYIAERFGGN